MTEELRSPLASIANGIGAVADGQPGPESQRYLAVAREDTRRLVGTIEDLMRIAHLRPPELREMETRAGRAVARARRRPLRRTAPRPAGWS